MTDHLPSPCHSRPWRRPLTVKAHGRRPTLKNLLLTFDVFGTLTQPRLPIARQYAEAASQFGIQADVHHVETSFREERVWNRAYCRESALHPNYGTSVGMKASQWWANVVRGTFKSYNPSAEVLGQLSERLYQRFSTKEAYRLQDGVLRLLQEIYQKNETTLESQAEGIWPWERTICGLLTNSDDRVRTILPRLGVPIMSSDDRHNEVDTDRRAQGMSFSVLSCEAGVEKPHPNIFWTAEEWLRAHLMNEGQSSSSSSLSSSGSTADPLDDWVFLHVGDDQKDVAGAMHAGWHAGLIERPTSVIDAHQQRPITMRVPRRRPTNGDMTVTIVNDVWDLRFWSPYESQTTWPEGVATALQHPPASEGIEHG